MPLWLRRASLITWAGAPWTAVGHLPGDSLDPTADQQHPFDEERQADLDQSERHGQDADDDEGEAAVIEDLLAPRAGRAACRLSWR